MEKISVAVLDHEVVPLLVFTGSRGLVRIDFLPPGRTGREDAAPWVEGFRRARDVEATWASSPDASVAGELEGFLSGSLTEFTLPVDVSGVRGFRRDVLEALSTVSYGSRVTYKELADMAGRPNAIRAAASGCATNPIPLVIPCHRVLRSDGSLGGYAGGVDLKLRLLSMEGYPCCVVG